MEEASGGIGVILGVAFDRDLLLGVIPGITLFIL